VSGRRRPPRKEKERTFQPPDSKLSAVAGSSFDALAELKKKLEKGSKGD
jgi:hypothetical protein